MLKIYAIAAAYTEELRNFEVKQLEMLNNKELYSSFTSEDMQGEEKAYQVINGIALYGIQGKMMSSGNWITKMFGIASYDFIGDDLAAIANDTSVDQVLLAMDTPGGHMAGIADLSDTWQRLNAVKPITVHTSGDLGSAGVWLASNSTSIYASETSDYGSIGVILQHVSEEKALDAAGIKVTEIKSSPLKHIGSPVKDLTKDEEAHLQGKVDEANVLFQTHMQNTRPGISPLAFSGEMFSAANAVKLGLIDGIDTYSGVFEQLSASAGSNKPNSYKEVVGMKRKVTAAMAEAAISAGAHSDTLDVIADEIYAELSDEEKGLEATLPIEGDEILPEEKPLDAEALAVSVQTLTDANEVLTTEFTASAAQVETLTAEIADLKTQLTEANSDPLRVIAEERIGVMRTAFGLTAFDFSGLSATALAIEYQAMDKQFKKLYTSGGHKPTEMADTAPVKPVKVVSIDRARTNATGL